MFTRADNSVGVMSIAAHSQNANVKATPKIRKTGNYLSGGMSQNASMGDTTDKNGGPNHLRAWMEFRGIKGVEMAEALGGNVTPGMVSDLCNSNRALSAKWLRRLAPVLDTTPGMLLDHNPCDLDSDIIDIWSHMDKRRQKQMVEIAKTLTGTNG